MAGRVVLIEGLDLAGKSTLIHNLQAELTRRGVPVRVSRNALCPNNPIAVVADQVRRDPAAGLVETAALFLAAHLWDLRHFTPPPDGVVHIQDSCWLRTLAFHRARGTPGLPRLLLRVGAAFPRCDAAVFLTASVQERQRRLAVREKQNPGCNDAHDHLVLRDPTSFLRMEKDLHRLALRFTAAQSLETSGLPRHVIAERALGLLGLRQER